MMEDYIKVTGKTVEDALLEASIQLGTASDNVEYRVIERETKGFLGIGAKKAVIEARKKKSDEDIMDELFAEKNKPAKAEPKKEELKKTEPKKAEPKKAEPKKAEVKKEEPKKAEPKKTEPKKEKPAAPAAKAETEKAEKTPSAPRAPRVPANPEEVKARAEKFLTDMFAAMGFEVKITQSFEDDTLSVNLDGENMGTLIGKRGQTLDSIQYLTSLVVNKGKASYVRVKIDTEDYRDRRKATLENLAKNIAFKVKKTRRPVYLEPMNPYERRIIHSALQNDPYVTTHSEGEEPNRKVVVTLRKKERASFRSEEE